MDATEDVRKNVRALVALISKCNQVRTILSYRAVPKWREIDLTTLENDLPGVRFAYVPVAADAPLPTEKYDIILVPLYGVNERGYRLGHGGGWYDKLLAAQPGAVKIGVGFEANRIAFVPERHDMPVDVVICS